MIRSSASMAAAHLACGMSLAHAAVVSAQHRAWPAAALDLFTVFTDHCERTGAPDLGEAIGLVYGMAVTTSAQLVREARQACDAEEGRP